jgi:hypothetical protein
VSSLLLYIEADDAINVDYLQPRVLNGHEAGPDRQVGCCGPGVSGLGYSPNPSDSRLVPHGVLFHGSSTSQPYVRSPTGITELVHVNRQGENVD